MFFDQHLCSSWNSMYTTMILNQSFKKHPLDFPFVNSKPEIFTQGLLQLIVLLSTLTAQQTKSDISILQCPCVLLSKPLLNIFKSECWDIVLRFLPVDTHMHSSKRTFIKKWSNKRTLSPKLCSVNQCILHILPQCVIHGAIQSTNWEIAYVLYSICSFQQY